MYLLGWNRVSRMSLSSISNWELLVEGLREEVWCKSTNSWTWHMEVTSDEFYAPAAVSPVNDSQVPDYEAGWTLNPTWTILSK
jgi:hypothetical protein